MDNLPVEVIGNIDCEFYYLNWHNFFLEEIGIDLFIYFLIYILKHK